MAEKMAVSLEHAAMLTVKDAGHDVHLDQPDAVAEALRTFIVR